jgi:hypothetical protein
MESETKERVGTRKRKRYHNVELAACTERSINTRHHEALSSAAVTPLSDDIDDVDSRWRLLCCPSSTSPVSPPSILASSYSSSSAIGS